MQNIVSMLNSMNPKELNDALAKAKAFAATAEGREMMNRLRSGKPIEGLPVTTEEQNKIIAEVTKNPQIARQLAQIIGKK